jgi:hypothetical protein
LRKYFLKSTSITWNTLVEIQVKPSDTCTWTVYLKTLGKFKYLNLLPISAAQHTSKIHSNTALNETGSDDETK